jgi:quercetin dioxygenase-like cupin family protein
MAVATAQPVKVTRWKGGQHPTLDNITQLMRSEGLRTYMWTNTPNFRYPIRSHGYDKTVYCVQGSLELTFPKTKQRVVLRSGDRVELPRGVRYSAIIGPRGAQCLEGSVM